MSELRKFRQAYLDYIEGIAHFAPSADDLDDTDRVKAGQWIASLDAACGIDPNAKRPSYPSLVELKGRRLHLVRGTVYPSEEAQALYPLKENPCSRCENEHLPHLVDNGSEFYWEHQWRGSGRGVCQRFGSSRGSPKEGTATPTHFKGRL